MAKKILRMRPISEQEFFDNGNKKQLNLETNTIYRNTNTIQEKKDVAQVQQHLSNFGYYKNEIDGLYGPKTKKAVENFQKDSKITVDGEVGSETLDKIASYKRRNTSLADLITDKNTNNSLKNIYNMSKKYSNGKLLKIMTTKKN